MNSGHGHPKVVAAIEAPYRPLLAPGTGQRPLSRRFVDDSKVSDHHAIIPTASPAGRSALGGDDMDRALAERLLQHMGASDKQRELVRLALDTARRVKHALTEATEVDVELPVAGGGEKKITVTRWLSPMPIHRMNSGTKEVTGR